MARNIDYAHFDVDMMEHPKIIELLDDGGAEAFVAWTALILWARGKADPDHLDRAGLISVPVARRVIGGLGLEAQVMVNLMVKHGLLDPQSSGIWQLHEFVEHQHLLAWRARLVRSAKGNAARWNPEALPMDVPKDVLKESPNPTQTLTKDQNPPSTADAFEAFWKIYPRRVGKIDARRKWDQALKSAAAQAIIDGAVRYAKQRDGQDPTKTCHPATWLNQGRWLDEDDATPTPPASREVAAAYRRQA